MDQIKYNRRLRDFFDLQRYATASLFLIVFWSTFGFRLGLRLI